MERTKDLFMDERIKAEILKDQYLLIPKEVRENIIIKAVDVPSGEYTKDSKWLELKKAADKAYKDLKDREYQIRMNHLDESHKTDE